MRIKFLGTSAGWPLPRLGCECKICSSKDPRDKRTRSQLLVNDILLLDIGPDTYLHLSDSKIDPLKIKYAAITHEHSDHTFGLWDLGHIYNSQKINIILAESTYKKISRLLFYNKYKITRNKIKFQEYESLLSQVNFDLTNLFDAGINHVYDEIGDSYLDIAKNKAEFYSKYSHLPIVADTSGLEIHAL